MLGHCTISCLQIILMGDFNGDPGNSLSDKDKHEPNERGMELLIVCSMGFGRVSSQ